MPNTPRRRLTRRSLPPRPTYNGAPQEEHRATHDEVRAARAVEHDAPFVAIELRRVFLISATCLGLLAVLTAVDRLG